MDWSLEPARAFKQDVRDSFDMHCRHNGIRAAGSMGRSVDMLFAAELKEVLESLPSD